MAPPLACQGAAVDGQGAGAEGGVVAGRQGAGSERRAAGIGVGPGQGQGAGAVFNQTAAGAGDHPAEGARVDGQGADVAQGARAVERGEGLVGAAEVDGRPRGDGGNAAGAQAVIAPAGYEGAGVDRGVAGIGVGPGQDQGARAGLGDPETAAGLANGPLDFRRIVYRDGGGKLQRVTAPLSVRFWLVAATPVPRAEIAVDVGRG